MKSLNSSKCAELQIVIWFLGAGWEVFTPVVDANQTDLVVRVPTSKQLLAIQVKHREFDGKNKGQLKNRWKKREAPFDYLILFQPEKMRGAIFHREAFPTLPASIEIYRRDKDGYSNREFRPRYSPVGFDLLCCSEVSKASQFAKNFLEIHTARIRPIPAKVPKKLKS
ncbi:MAG: hypothetical protein ABI318_06660 [Chthoniobacteraceae bacterium]